MVFLYAGYADCFRQGYFHSGSGNPPTPPLTPTPPTRKNAGDDYPKRLPAVQNYEVAVVLLFQ